MLTKIMIQEIQDLKLRGYSKKDIADYYTERGMDPPSAPTIRKYYDMDVVPEDPGKNLEKDKVFDHEPFRAVVIEVLRNNENNKDLYISSVYDYISRRRIIKSSAISGRMILFAGSRRIQGFMTMYSTLRPENRC